MTRLKFGLDVPCTVQGEFWKWQTKDACWRRTVQVSTWPWLSFQVSDGKDSFSQTLSPGCTEPDDDADLRGSVVTAGEEGSDAREDWRTA